MNPSANPPGILLDPRALDPRITRGARRLGPIVARAVKLGPARQPPNAPTRYDPPRGSLDPQRTTVARLIH